MQGHRFGGRVVDAKIVIIGDVGPNVKTWERENFEYGGQTKKREKRAAPAGFTFFPSFVASGTKNTYVECTKALRHLVSTYLKYDMKTPSFVPF